MESWQEKSLVTLFTESATAHLHSTALIFDDGVQVNTTTYSMLMKYSDQVAKLLQKNDVTRECIGVVMKSSASLIAVLIGVMKGECWFCPLHEQVPGGFLHNITERLHIRAFLVDTSLCQKLAEQFAEPCVGVELDGMNATLLVLSSQQRHSWPCLLAYCITTSGTTGQPKIVKVPHRCILPNIIAIRELYKLSSRDVVFQASPITFDPSIVEIFTALSVGAKLLVVPDILKKVPKVLTVILERHKVSVIQGTPTLIQSLSLDILLEAASPLRVLAFGGESFPNLNTVNACKHVNNKTAIYNIYGITEVSSWATCFKLPEKYQNARGVPLGKALLETLVEVHDSNGLVITSGTGKLFIGGSSRQCLIDEEDSFRDTVMRDTGDMVTIDNCQLYYTGREDEQIKRHGQRLSLHELSQVCSTVEGVQEAVAVYNNNVLYIVVRLSDKFDPSSVIKATWRMISHNLLMHCKPDHIIAYRGTFPFTKHGKVDKKKLCEEVKRGLKSSHVAPPIRTAADIEAMLRQEWQAVLNIIDAQLIKTDSRFLELGGDSFSCLKLLDIMETHYLVRMTGFLDKLLAGTFGDVLGYLQSQILNDRNIRKVNAGSGYTSLGPTSAKIAKVHDTEDSNVSPNQACAIHESRRWGIINSCAQCLLLQGTHGTVSIQRCNKVRLYKQQTDGICTMDVDLPHLIPYEVPHKPGNLTLKVIWKNDLGKCIDASPLIVNDRCSSVAYIGSHSHIFKAVDVTSGDTLWATQLGDRIESSAALSRCTKFIIVGCYDGTLNVLERGSGTLVWSFVARGHIKSSPEVDPCTGIVYVGCHDHSIYALNIEERRLQWQQPAANSSVYSSPCICHPHLYVTSLSGKLLSLQPSNGEVTWEAQLDKPAFSSPKASSANVYVGCVDGNIYSYSHDGVLIWKYKTGGPIFSSPSLLHVTQHNLLLCGSHDEHLYCISSTGVLNWKTRATSAVFSSPFVFSLCDKHQKDLTESQRQYIAVCDTQGNLMLHDLSQGTLLKRLSLPGEVFSSPVITGNKIVVGCRNNYLYCIEVMVN